MECSGDGGTPCDAQQTHEHDNNFFVYVTSSNDVASSTLVVKSSSHNGDTVIAEGPETTSCNVGNGDSKNPSAGDEVDIPLEENADHSILLTIGFLEILFDKSIDSNELFAVALLQWKIAKDGQLLARNPAAIARLEEGLAATLLLRAMEICEGNHNEYLGYLRGPDRPFILSLVKHAQEVLCNSDHSPQAVMRFDTKPSENARGDKSHKTTKSRLL